MIDAPHALQQLLQLARQVNRPQPVDTLLSEVAGCLMRLLAANHASVRLLDETGSNLVAGARVGEGAEGAPVTFERGQGLIGWVAQHGQAALVGDCQKDPRFLPAPGQGFPIRSMLAVPLLSTHEPIGVLAASSPEPSKWSDDDEAMAWLVANSTVPALERARLDRLSLTDHLTRTYNRRYLIHRLNEEFELAKRSGAPLSVLLLDLDKFKQVNVTRGRQVGDRVLASFAERTRQVVRRCDVLVRRGGEEFVLVMPGTTIADAIAAAHRIWEVTGSIPLAGGDDVDVRVTVAIGAVEWDRVEDAEQLDARAELAMYDARTRRKPRVAAG
jgi:diguanylate cyclase (GGDEF)-like protein